jgi:DNA-directed RNA polymerase subunit RPC12/RpoP
MKDEDTLNILLIKKNPALFEEWKKYHSNELKSIADAKTKTEQILELRKVTVSAIETSTRTLKFIDIREKAEQKILAQRLNMGELTGELITLEAQLHAFNRASGRCFRGIAAILGDAGENDWFSMYCDLYSQFISEFYEALITEEKGDIYILRPLLKAAKDLIDDIKPKILEGRNWNYRKDTQKYECMDCGLISDELQLESDKLFCPECGGRLEYA